MTICDRPYAALAGAHLYLAEGVLATIEVKSNLTKEEVECASKNIASVRSLQVSHQGLGGSKLVEGAALTLNDLSMESVAGRIQQGLDPTPTEDPLLTEAPEQIWSYVFAFSGLKIATLRKHATTNGWFDDRGPDCLCILGKSFGATDDSPIRPHAASTDAVHFFIEETSEPLGWYLVHLLWALNRTYRRAFLRPYVSRE